MIFSQEDTKIPVEKFQGLYNRGSDDEVPVDHARDSLNVVHTSEGHVKTRDGVIKSIALPQNGGLRRFFVMTAVPPNIGEPLTSNPTSTDGDGLLWLDNANHLYIGNDPTPLLTLGGMADFSAINIANRTYVSPNTGQAGLLKGKLKLVNPLTGGIRDAAGHAPEQAGGSSLSAANSVSSGNVPPGLHKIAVIYETESGFWTQPGPKIYKTAVPVPSNPTVFAATGHKMLTGESHRIAAVGTWGFPFDFSDTWHVTRIDDDHFSVPVDSTTFGGGITSTFTVAAGFVPAEVISDGAHGIEVSAIPLGGTGVKRRIILATRADEEEFFFVPNVPGSQSEINDNTTVSTVINFDDTDLVDSADYLFDILEAIPGGSSMCKYRNRLIITGPFLPGIQERILVSNINDFETFNWVSGYVQIQNERDNNDVFGSFVLRDVLYLTKFVGTFATQDNGDNPSTWPVTVIDGVVGTYAHGTSTFTETQEAPDTGDMVVLASKSGLYLFDGVFRRPELSWKIEKLWGRINAEKFFRVTVTHDPWRHRIYVSVPLDEATEPSHVLVCDYSDGRTADAVRWSVFQFHKNPSCIGMVYFGSLISTPRYTLKIGSLDAGNTYLYSMEEGVKNDDGNVITSNYCPGPFYVGGVGCFKLLHFRSWGVGRLNITLTGEDGVLSTVPPYLTLSAAPGRELDRQINFTNEKLHIRIANGNSLNDYMIIDRLDVHGLQLWPIRPSV